MVIPKHINILGRKVKVVVKKLDGLYGDYENFNKKIQLNSLQNKEDLEETLLHEVMHAIFDLMCIRWNKGDNEEALIRQISPVLYQVIKENKWIV